MHGEGKLTFADGVVYEGDFNYNSITGKVKTLFRENTRGQMAQPTSVRSKME
jgi:hypothetical protein